MPMVDPGLSPRARGSRRHPPQPRPRVRSIPACAGEPNYGSSWTAIQRVYPRVRGGAVEMNNRNMYK